MPGPLFINLDDIDGEVTTPLALACDKGSPDEVRSYLAMGYDPNEWCRDRRPLYFGKRMQPSPSTQPPISPRDRRTTTPASHQRRPKQGRHRPSAPRAGANQWRIFEWH